MKTQRLNAWLIGSTLLCLLFGPFIPGAPVSAYAPPASLIDKVELFAPHATPPTEVTLAGPTEVYLGATTTFSATVGPPTVDLPLTFDWGATDLSPAQHVNSSRYDALALTWTLTGLKTLTVTATNTYGVISTTYQVNVLPMPQPDLQIADIWNQAHSLGYQLYNAGTLTATGSYTSGIVVDSVTFQDSFALDLGPGERLNRLLVGTIWVCSGTSDVIQVKADSTNVISESNELNNNRKETWTCDSTAPVITGGPTVSGRTETQVTIAWRTNEASTSRVVYGTRPEAYGQAAYDAVLVTAHQLTLTNLLPGTVYQYKVWSSDAQGNSIIDDPQYFETAAPPPVQAPGAAPISVTLQADGTLRVTLPLTQADQVERVEFFWNGQRIGTDYSGEPGTVLVADQLHGQQVQATASNYVAAVRPISITGYLNAREFVSDTHTITVSVYQAGTVGSPTEFGFMYDPPTEFLPAPQVNLTHPDPDYHLLINAAAMPANATIDFMATAIRYEWHCQYGAGMAVNCDSVARGFEHMRFYGNWTAATLCTSQAESDRDIFHTCTASLAGLMPGTYQIMGCAGEPGEVACDEHMITIEQATTLLNVEKTMRRDGNRFEVTLDISNHISATGTATVDWFSVSEQGFQVLAKETAIYAVYPVYDTWVNSCRTLVNFQPSDLQLAPGQSVQVTYSMIPIMYEQADYAPYANTVHAFIRYQVNAAWQIKDFFLDNSLVREGANWRLMLSEVEKAFGAADYLIVTNPSELDTRYITGDTDTLLATMAHLAYLKQGVLGYLESDDPDVLNELLEASSSEFRWANRMHPNFNEVSQGYVLLVGEDTIIDAYREGSFFVGVIDDEWTWRMVGLTDNPYGHTQGSGRPDLIVGRVIGNSAARLTKVIQTSINNYLNVPGYSYDWSHAVVVSGVGKREEVFQDDANDIKNYLQGDGFNVKKIDWEFDAFIKTKEPFSFAQYDGFAAGDVNGDGTTELVVARDAGNTILILDGNGNEIRSFTRDFEDGDGFAVGDVNDDGKDEIIVGDRNDHICTYDQYGTELDCFTIGDFEEHDGLAAGNVTTANPGDELVFADRGGWLVIYAMDGTQLHKFNRSFEQFDGLAVGNLGVPTDRDEIVIGDRSADRIYTYYINDNGQLTEMASFARDFEYGDGLAVGDVRGDDGLAKIIIGDRNNNIYVYSLTGGELVKIYCDFQEYDGLTVRWMSGIATDEIWHADRGDRLRAADPLYPAHARQVFTDNAANRDVICFRGHGNINVWGPALTTEHFPLNFGNTAPFVFAISCLTGKYSDYSIAEAFLDSRAAVYIGSTEKSLSDENSSASRWFFAHWEPTETLGKAFIDLERNKWSGDSLTDGWAYWVHEYNFYGDPKFGHNSPTLPRNAAAQMQAVTTVFTPTETLVIQLPDYELTTEEGWMHATIPGGEVRLEPENYEVPYYRVVREIPAGQRLQNVTLTGRSEFELSTGIYLTLTHRIEDCCTADHPRPGAASAGPNAPDAPDADEDWTPALDQIYDWEVLEDGADASTLVINLYPFYYNATTANVRYHQTYTLTLETITTTLSTVAVTLDKVAYAQGESVAADLTVQQPGAPQDLVVEARVRQTTTDAEVATLLYQSLNALTGEATFAATWDSTGYAPGSYYVEVALCDFAGQVLQKAVQDFQLGIIAGEVVTLTATPATFTIGDVITLALSFRNAGTVPLTGTAFLVLQTADGLTTTLTYTEPLANLLPAQTAQIEATWNTAGAARTDYRLLGYVQHDGRVTGPTMVDLTVKSNSIYLPLVLRRVP